MNKTPNYNLNLPEYVDLADVAKLNENMVVLDSELNNKISKPSGGIAGDYLTLDSNGRPTWGGPITISIIRDAVTNWMSQNVDPTHTIVIDTTLANAQQAAESKTVGDNFTNVLNLINTIHNKILLNLEDIPLSDFTVYGYRIERSTKKWVSLNNSGYYISLPSNCKQILIKGNSSYATHYAFLSALVPSAGADAPVLGNVNVMGLGEIINALVPTGANYLYIQRMNGDGHRTDPQRVSFYYQDENNDIAGLLGDVINLKQDASSKDAQLLNINTLLSALDQIVNGEIYYQPVEMQTSDMTATRFYIYTTTGVAYDFSGSTSYITEIGDCKKVYVEANGSYNAHIAFLTSASLVNNVRAPLVGDSLPIVITTSSTLEVDVPEGATHFYVRRLDTSGHNVYPEALYFKYERRAGGLATDAYVASTKTGRGTVTATGATLRPAVSLKLSISPSQSGRGDASPDNIRPAVGVSSVSYTVSREPEQGTPVTVPLDATLYGGSVDVITGEITEEYHCHTFTGNETFSTSGSWVVVSMGSGNQSASPEEGFCSHYEYRPYRANCIGVMRNEVNCTFDGTLRTAEEWAAYCANQYALGTPVQVVYKLRTPKKTSGSRTTIEMGVGKNYISSDVNGGISIKYYMDINSAFEELNGGSEESDPTESSIDDTPTPGSMKPVTSNGIYNALANVQGMLPYDSTPTVNSDNPVTSDGIARAIANKQDALTFDATPATNSANPVTSAGIKSAIDAITDRISILTASVIGKVALPLTSPNGTSGQILRTNGDGTTAWVDPATPTSVQVSSAVEYWLDQHPDATTSVEDFSLTENKLVQGTLGYYSPDMFGAVGDGVVNDHMAIQMALEAAGVGGTIKIPVGKIYNIGTSGFTLLEGQTVTGGGTLLQTENGNGAVCVLYAVDKTTIDGITIVQQNYHTGYGIRIGGSNITIKNCKIYDKYVGMTGDNIYGDNVKIFNNLVTFTRNGIYVSQPTSARRRTGLQICDNIVIQADGYDVSIGAGQDKGINIGGCSGAIVRGNILLGMAMCFCSYRWTDHTIYDHNISDYYVSVIGDYNVVTNNIIDGDLTPEIHFPVTTAGMMCAIEVVGDGSTVANNIIRNNNGPAVSCNDPKRHGIVVHGNYIENCAIHAGVSSAALNILGQSDAIISHNIIRNCGNANKGYGAINMSGYKLYPITNVIIANNVIEGIQNNTSLGAMYFRYANNIKISGNILRCSGRCISLGIDCQFVRDVSFCDNTFEGVSFSNALTYTNEVRMWDNDFRSAVVSQDVSNAQALCKNRNNEGFVAAMPERCTFEIGEVYPTIEGLKRCTTPGTFGTTTLPYVYADTIKATTTEGSSVIHVNIVGAVMLSIGQYISIDGVVDKAKVVGVVVNYDESNNISGADVTLSANAEATVVNSTVLYSPPIFTTIR